MLFSVIVPTCNRWNLLRLCLELLSPESQSIDSFCYEVIVTDDSQHTSSQLAVEQAFPWVKWVEGPKKGPAANRNNGAKHAKGEWLIFFDDDCLPDKNIILLYQKAITEHKDILVFEGCIKTDKKQQSLIEESPVNYDGGYLWSCNFMINKRVFIEDLKGFDEKFPYPSMEDVDLHYRLNKLNYICFFIRNAVVIHPWRIQKKLISITLKRYRSTLYFLDKHPEKRKDINSKYYLRAFSHIFFGQTVMKSIPYGFRGFFPKIANDILHLFFAVHQLFLKRD